MTVCLKPFLPSVVLKATSAFLEAFWRGWLRPWGAPNLGVSYHFSWIWFSPNISGSWLTEFLICVANWLRLLGDSADIFMCMCVCACCMPDWERVLKTLSKKWVRLHIGEWPPAVFIDSAAIKSESSRVLQQSEQIHLRISLWMVVLGVWQARMGWVELVHVRCLEQSWCLWPSIVFRRTFCIF